MGQEDNWARSQLWARNRSKRFGQGKGDRKLFMSLLIKPKCNYTVLESLHWFQVLSYNGLCSVDFRARSKVWVFSPYLCHGTAIYWVGACFYLKQTANYTVNIWAAREESSFLLGWQCRKKDNARFVIVSVWCHETPRCLLQLIISALVTELGNNLNFCKAIISNKIYFAIVDYYKLLFKWCW